MLAQRSRSTLRSPESQNDVGGGGAAGQQLLPGGSNGCSDSDDGEEDHSKVWVEDDGLFGVGAAAAAAVSVAVARCWTAESNHQLQVRRGR